MANEFVTGILQGLYEGGVGNPQVNRENQLRRLQLEYYKTALAKEMAESGIQPAQGFQGKDTGGMIAHLARMAGQALYPGAYPETQFAVPKPFDYGPTLRSAYPGLELPTGPINLQRAKEFSAIGGQSLRAQMSAEGLQLRQDQLDEMKRYHNGILALRDDLVNASSLEKITEIERKLNESLSKMSSKLPSDFSVGLSGLMQRTVGMPSIMGLGLSEGEQQIMDIFSSQQQLRDLIDQKKRQLSGSSGVSPSPDAGGASIRPPTKAGRKPLSSFER